MDVLAVGAPTTEAVALIGLVVAAAAIVIVVRIRTSRKAPLDPEENLRLLLGPAGMAERDRNRAASDAAWNAEFREHILKAIGKHRSEGNIAEAEKLEAYARSKGIRL
jgi:hypothetical protein